MVTVYTAIGSFDTRVIKSKSGEPVKVPIVRAMGNEYLLSEDELLLWSTLAWKFMLKDDLIREFNSKRAEAHIFSDVSPERIIDILVERGLVSKGEDITFEDAMYNLLASLQPKPLKISFFAKLTAAFHLVIVRGMPIKAAIGCLRRSGRLKGDKNAIMKLINRFEMTTAEIIKCFDVNAVNIKNNDELVDALSRDDAIADSIPLEMRFSDVRKSIILDLTELYESRKIILENLPLA